MKGLPAAGRIVRSAHCVQRNDGVFFELNRPLVRRGPRTLLVVPKVAGQSFADDGEVVFAYVLDGTNLLNAEPIDLSRLTRKVLDWGGLAKTYEAAARWQVSETDHVQSKSDLERFLRR